MLSLQFKQRHTVASGIGDGSSHHRRPFKRRLGAIGIEVAHIEQLSQLRIGQLLQIVVRVPSGELVVSTKFIAVIAGHAANAVHHEAGTLSFATAEIGIATCAGEILHRQREHTTRLRLFFDVVDDRVTRVQLRRGWSKHPVQPLN